MLVLTGEQTLGGADRDICDVFPFWRCYIIQGDTKRSVCYTVFFGTGY